jgi:hypothetical protein
MLLSFILNEFCSRFGMAVPFILPTVRRSSVGSFVERDCFIRIAKPCFQWCLQPLSRDHDKATKRRLVVLKQFAAV